MNMFTKKISLREKMLKNFTVKYGKFKSYDGREVTKIGIGLNEKDQEVVVLVDQDENLRLIPKDFFEGNVLLLHKGFVKRFEQIV